MNRTASFAATIAGCFVCVTLGSASVASAQVVSSFRDLQGSLNGGERLTITEHSGVITKGRFVALSDQSLRVRAESGRLVDFPELSVAKIDHLRSRKGKGALLGFVGGALVGALAVALTPSCSGFGCVGPRQGTAVPLAAAFFGGIGAGIGSGVGAMRPHGRLIYLAPGGKAGQLVPFLHEHGLSVRVGSQKGRWISLRPTEWISVRAAPAVGKAWPSSFF